MRDRQRVNRVILACSQLLIFLLVAGCGKTIQPSHSRIAFVHATDPHVFLSTAQSEKTKDVGVKQQSLDEKALTDMFRQMRLIADEGHALRFVVLTGDFGVEPCSIASLPASATDANNTQPTAKQCLDNVDGKKRSDEVTKLAELLAQSPVPEMYLVAGNNDIPFEVADDAGLIYFNHFIDDVQRKIDEAQKPVHLHNLTSCYFKDGIASTCYADIAETSYRLIGFPSYSFRNRDTGRQLNTPLQERQFETFRTLLDQARQAGRRALIVSHIPLIDDPFSMAQDLYATLPKIDRDLNNPQSQWSTWNVSKKLSDDWEETVAADFVAGVLAGHLHDSHKEIYRQPYTWSTVNDHKTGFSKLYMAPPLSVKNQDTSPIQARGFSLVRLDPEQIDYRVYWYEAKTCTFTPERPLSSAEPRWRPSWTSAASIRWLWELADPLKSLDRMAVLLIALLAAFLTVVQIWQIPEPENPLAAKAMASDQNAGGAQTGEPKPAFAPSPFASNFGKTVIAGLGGLAAETVLKALEGKPSAEDKEFYIIWFILFFFALLVVTAGLRAMAEALRARLAIIHYPLTRPTRPIADQTQKSELFWDWLTYWWLRFVHWFFSLRLPLLTLFDTFINLIQGKNQTLTRVFSDKIIDQQRNAVSVANAIRTHLNDAIRQFLLQKTPKDKIDEGVLNPRNVRVNISVLSADQTNVFYIARTPGSSVKAFSRRSVAWVSVFAGKIRWYKRSYKDNANLMKEIVLFDNSDGTIPGDEPKIYLNSHYQLRDDDYEAFVIFPVPWPQRNYGTDYVKGAIHISFRRESDFNLLWEIGHLTEREKALLKQQAAADAAKRVDEEIKNETDSARRKVLEGQRQSEIDRAASAIDTMTCDPVKDQKTYRFEDKMLEDWCNDCRVRAILREAIVVLGELLRGFNENIYKNSGPIDSA